MGDAIVCNVGQFDFGNRCNFSHLSGGTRDDEEVELKNWKETKVYKKDVDLIPKELDEKVVRLHLPALGAELTTLTKAQSLGMSANGPFTTKPTSHVWLCSFCCDLQLQLY